MIADFIRDFTDKSIGNIIKIRNRYYLADKELVELKQKIKLEPEAIGLFLGEEIKNDFKPSPALIDEIAKISTRKIFVNEKGEWLFLCGRDLFGKSVIKANTNYGLVLVQSMRDENLGYGKFIGNINDKERIVIKNLLDKGDYLRREMTKR
jgi:60S ribosome subunit biogenesis protein NIP7